MKHLEGRASPCQHRGYSSQWYIDATPVRPDLIINSLPQIIHQIIRGIIHLFVVCSETSYRYVSGVWLNATSVLTHEYAVLLICMITLQIHCYKHIHLAANLLLLFRSGQLKKTASKHFTRRPASLVSRLHQLSCTLHRYIGIRRKTNGKHNTEDLHGSLEIMTEPKWFSGPCITNHYPNCFSGNPSGEIHVSVKRGTSMYSELPKAGGFCSIKVKARVENPVQAIPSPTCSEAALSQQVRSYWPLHSEGIGRLDQNWERDQCIWIGEITGWENKSINQIKLNKKHSPTSKV